MNNLAGGPAEGAGRTVNGTANSTVNAPCAAGGHGESSPEQ